MNANFFRNLKGSWLLIALCVLSLAVVGCEVDDGEGDVTSTASNNNSSNNTSNNTSSSGAVAFTGSGVSPSSVTISAGGTVTWTNNDSIDHIVSCDDGGAAGVEFGPGQSYSRSFPSRGDYTCKSDNETTAPYQLSVTVK